MQFLYRELRSTLRELIAHQALLHSIAVENAVPQEHLDFILSKVMFSPELEERLDILFGGFDEAIERNDEERVDQLVRIFAERYRPTFPTH